ncbi:hypothetical protein JCM10450v2_006168 [Rhodotorula kratochvilovae]
MHRVIATTRLLRPAVARPFSTSPCCCHPPPPDGAHQSAPASAPADPLSAYSSPFDAFAADSHPGEHAADPPRPSSRPATSTSRPRQRQLLSNAEAQAFADLLGEILPRSTRPPTSGDAASSAAGGAAPGLFDIFSPGAAAAQSPDVAAGVTRVQQALLRKVGQKMGVTVEPGSGRWERKARTELTERESLELDRLREELVTLRSDKDVLDWGMRNVFGFQGGVKAGILPDPTTLPIELPRSIDAGAADARAPPAVGPSSRIFPDLLHLLFVVLRDTHQAPHAALSVFALAASNPFSYIAGCTTALYNEVLRTRWAEGDVESLLGTLEEMRAAGVALDDRTRELVAAVGEAMRVDADRAEVRVQALVDARVLGGGTGILDARERDAAVARHRFFSSRQADAWARMERIVEENLGELERARRERDEERWHAQERARMSLEELERGDAERERPALVSRRRLSPYDDGGPSRREPRDDRDRGERAPMTPFGWREPRMEVGPDGKLTMPKRPSFANPFKIRRKGLSKEEKSAKDNKHPALWWKQ